MQANVNALSKTKQISKFLLNLELYQVLRASARSFLQIKQNSNSFSNSKHIQVLRTRSNLFSNQGKITCSSSNFTKFKFIFTSNETQGLQIKQSSSVEKKVPILQIKQSSCNLKLLLSRRLQVYKYVIPIWNI